MLFMLWCFLLRTLIDKDLHQTFHVRDTYLVYQDASAQILPAVSDDANSPPKRFGTHDVKEITSKEPQIVGKLTVSVT